MSEREDDLERRVKALEAAVEDMKKALYGRPTWPVMPAQVPTGCVCPLGAERACMTPMCPRRPWVAT